MSEPSTPPPLAPDDTSDRAETIELFISTLLRVGVICSFSIVLIGTIVTFVRHPTYATSHDELSALLHPRNDTPYTTPHSLSAVWQGLKLGSGQAVVVVGLIVLLATPVMRVAISILTFAYMRDKVFALITALVLALLILSFVLGKAEG